MGYTCPNHFCGNLKLHIKKKDFIYVFIYFRKNNEQVSGRGAAGEGEGQTDSVLSMEHYDMGLDSTTLRS